jgi:hypothetical protein
MTAHERSGWRDHGALPPPISTWHRDWGHNVPMVDIDFLAIDYDREKPVAIIDYKEHSKPLAKVIADLRDCSNDRTLRNVADRLGVAYMVVRYWDRVRAFQVFPRNERAKTIYKEATVRRELVLPA